MNRNAGITSDANRYRERIGIGNVGVKGNEAIFISKSKKQSPTETSRVTEGRSDCYSKLNVRPLRFARESKETRKSNSNVNTNVNVNRFIYKLAGSFGESKKGHANDTGEENKDNAMKQLPDELSSHDIFGSKRKKLKAFKNTNKIGESNSRVDDAVGNGHRENDDEKAERTSNSTEKTLYNSWSERDGKYYQ